MNIENWIRSQVNSGQQAEISLALLERQFGDFFFGTRLTQWVNRFANELGVKATIHAPSDCVTFYPRTSL